MKHIERWKGRASLLQQMSSVADPDHNPLPGVKIATAKRNHCCTGAPFPWRERVVRKRRGRPWLWFLSSPSCVGGRGAHERWRKRRRTTGMQKAL
jgi:hypothetical protein